MYYRADLVMKLHREPEKKTVPLLVNYLPYRIP